MSDHVMRTDEELGKCTVSELRPHNAPITLVEYDPPWPALFAREAERIRAVLGLKALWVEHVGSTSVPGLWAKPTIDIVLVVSDSSDESSYVPALEGAGYKLKIREPDWYQHRMFKGPNTDINLHVFRERHRGSGAHAALSRLVAEQRRRSGKIRADQEGTG